MRVPPKTLLIPVMAFWTVLTLAAGLYAVEGSAGAPSPSSNARAAEQAARTPDRTGTPAAGRVTRTPDVGATRTVPEPTATATERRPRSTPTPRPYPIPEYAQSAGVEGGAASAGGAPAQIRDAGDTPPKGVVVLDPGHGRGDPGAVHHQPDGTPDVLESEMNLRNAVLIRDELAAMGYDVYLTRDGAGRGPDGPLVQQFIVNDLLWRVQLATAVDADLYLALHGNGASVTSISGPETWYCGQHQQGSRNARLAAMIQRAMMDALHEYGYFPPDRGIMEDAERHHSGDFCQFVVTRENTVPSALLEFLFLSNDDDARVLADGRSQEILARHVARAIDEFLTTDDTR
jgi:N-acetylmuramoyl-L-alanine amidase